MSTASKQPCEPKRKWRPCVAVLSLAFGSTVPMAAQVSGMSTIPPSAPTNNGVSPSQLPSANPPVSPSGTTQADIFWDGAILQVRTTNAGLNGLLRDIASKANLQITGSVPEERIFGSYGPGKLVDVLSELLDGVAVNMLFVDRPGTASKQLVLTSRAGGPTLPSQSVRNNSTESPNPAAPPNDPPQDQAQQPPGAAPQPAGNQGETQAPSDATRTPQQIFEQLQRLRAQTLRRQP